MHGTASFSPGRRLEVASLSADTYNLQYQITGAAHDAGTASTQDLQTASVNAATAMMGLATAKSAVQLAALALLSDDGILGDQEN